MDEMNITIAQYTCDEQVTIKVIFSDGSKIFVPNGVLDNRHYAEIVRQVEEGTLTIAAAE